MSEAITRLNAALEGRYRIGSELGEGGMATVYLAEDIKHERQVALKVLKPELAAVVGAERFLAEIKTTANLTHPNILPLFDSGEADSYVFYVMPYVEGESLRDKLDREHQLPVDDAVRIATNVAEALDYAHQQGVIHRDIKPANILMQAGKPVISDFGIALAVGIAGGGRLTETGLSLGTPHYMSPEQATGDQNVGPQTDTYALGCVLYEMLVGDPPYPGSTAQAVLGKIIAGKPVSATDERPSIPPNVDAAIRKALEKLPADRFSGAQEFARALADPGFRHGETEAPEVVASVGPWKRLTVAFGMTAVLLAGLAAWGWLGPERPPLRADLVRFTINPPASARLGFRGENRDLAISPDGTLIVYMGPASEGITSQLYLQPLKEFRGAPLRGGEGGVGPVISPDGEWVAFIPADRPSTLERVSTLGGVPMLLTDARSVIRGVSWGADHRIVFGTAYAGLFRIAEGGGVPEALTTVDSTEVAERHVWPSVIDGREAVVFVISPLGLQELVSGQLAVLDIDSRKVTRLGLQGVSPRYVSTGHLVYAMSDGSVSAVPFDVESLTITGSPVLLVEGVSVKSRGAANFDISDGGRLVYASGEAGAGAQRFLVWADRNGREEPIAAPRGAYVYPRLSPNESRLALDERGEEDEILIWDFGGETLTRLSLGDGLQTYPVWTPDGERVAYGGSAGLFWKASNNTGAPEMLADASIFGGAESPSPYFFTSDGTALVFRDQANPGSGDDLVMISIEDDARVVWRLADGFHERNAELSPSGRWMAYQSDESGDFEIYVRPFPQVEGDLVPVSNNGGLFPLWSRDGRELFYLQPSATGFQLASVSIDVSDPDAPFAFSDRKVVMEWPYYAESEGRNYDVSSDGRFVAVKLPEGIDEGIGPGINVVLNWFEELKQRMGGN